MNATKNGTFLADFCGEPEFWPDENEFWNSTDPILRSCFRKSVLKAAIPCFCFFFWWLPFEALSVSRSRNRNVPKSIVGNSKNAATLGLILIRAIDLGFALFQGNYKVVDIFQLSTQILTYITIYFLNPLYRNRGFRISGFLWRFFFVSTVCSALDLYFLIRTFAPTKDIVIESVSLAFILISFIAHFFSEPPPFYSTASPESSKNNNECPESSAGYPSSLLFIWFDKLMWTGFKRPLTVNDLWDYNPQVQTSVVNPEFLKHWTRPRGSKEPHKRIRTIPAIIKTYWFLFLCGAFCKLCQDVLLLCSPILLKYMIQFVSSPSAPLWQGVLLAFALFANKAISSLCLSRYFYIMGLIGMKVKTSLTSLIYQKSLRLSSATRKDITTGEIVNLMSVDVQKFVELMSLLNTVWSGPFQIGTAIFLLCNTLGPSALAGVGIMILLIPCNGIIAVTMKNLQQKLMKLKDKRIKKMNEILQGIKIIKLYAWEDSFKRIVSDIRAEEIQFLKKIAVVFGCMVILMLSAPFIISLITFATYALSDPENNVLNAETVFVSIALFNILRFPLSMLSHVITGLIHARVSMKRVDNFLNADELDEFAVQRVFDDEDVSICKRNAVSVRNNASFSWDNRESVLKDIELDIPAGSFIAIVGTVGSGKSTLLSSFLGELNQIRGKPVEIRGSVAYVGQQSWMQNQSLKENILFGNKSDEDWYQTVVTACALLPDFEVLPAGDQTEIGEKGINLSGGQKQRVSLARAVYSKADIYLLDDPLSAVDSHVGKHLYEALLSSETGLLSKKTRVWVTNDIHHLPFMDKIVVMKDGTISQIGTYQQLVKEDGSFSDFIDEFSKRNPSESVDNPETPSILDIGRTKNDESDGEKDDALGLDVTKDPQQYGEEEVQFGKVSRKVYFYLFREMGKLKLTALLSAFVLGQIFTTSGNFWLSYWSDSSSLTDDLRSTTTYYYLGIYTILGVLQIAFTVMSTICLNLMLLTVSRTLHNKMLESILRSPMSFFDTTPSGRILNRFGQDVEILDTKINFAVFSCITGSLSLISVIAIIGYGTPIFLLPATFIILLYFFILQISVSTSRQLKRLQSVAASPIYSFFAETLAGISTIRAYSLQNGFYLRFQKKLDKYQKCNYPATISSYWLTVRVEMIGNFIVFSASLFSVLAKDSVTPGQLGLSISCAMTITSLLNWVIRMYFDIENNIVSAERIKEYSETASEGPWETDQIVDDWPSKGYIEIINYSVKYRPELDFVLKDCNVKIEGGEKVGIVGRTGSGKSTITLSLFRLLEAEAGKIRIDGINIKDIGLGRLRRSITIIPQDPVLFSGTLRQNLDPETRFSDRDLWLALEHAHLKEFASNDGGLDRIISESGGNISVGQRQLVCLARALLKKTKILILDEATAAVDLKTDGLIQSTIKQNFSDCTVIIIAHRIHTLMDYCTKILVLDKGKVKEFDSPQNLLQNSDSMFYDMCITAGIDLGFLVQ